MNIYKPFFLALFCAALFLPQGASAASSDLPNLIKNRYAQTSSFEANFEQTLTQKESGAKEQRSGKIQFQKPLLARWQTNAPHEETLVINSREIWDYLPDEEIAYRYPPQLVEDSRSIIQVITGNARLTEDFDVKAQGSENGLSKLLLYPHEPTTQLTEAMLWVDPDTGYIRRAQVTDFYGNTNDVRFTSFRPNVSLPASTFNFTPPKNVDVEDHTKKQIQERDLFK